MVAKARAQSYLAGPIVGVTSGIGGSPSSANPDAVEQLAAQAIWKQSFTYLALAQAALS